MVEEQATFVPRALSPRGGLSTFQSGPTVTMTR